MHIDNYRSIIIYLNICTYLLSRTQTAQEYNTLKEIFPFFFKFLQIQFFFYVNIKIRQFGERQHQLRVEGAPWRIRC